MSSVFCFLIVSLVFSSKNENYPEALKVSGLVGMKACINGVYYRGDDLKFGHPFYQKKETEDQIRWTIIWNSGILSDSARWLLMYDLQNPRSVIALLKSKHLLLNSKAWFVSYGEERWEKNPDMKLSEWDGKREFVKMVRDIEAKNQHCPKALKLCGIGPMSGVYYLGDSLHCERIFYQKEKTDTNHCTIRWYSDGPKWILNYDGLRPDGAFNADLEDDVLLPLVSEKKWRVYNGGNYNNSLQISEWKGTLRELLAKMKAITIKDFLTALSALLAKMKTKDFLTTLPYYAFYAMVFVLPVLTYFAFSLQSLGAGEYKQCVISFLPILQMFYRTIYRCFFEKKLQKIFGQKINDFIEEVSFYIVYFLLEAVVMGNLYTAFLSIVTIGAASFISSMLSKVLASKTRLSDDHLSCVRILAYMLVSNYVLSYDKLDFFLFWRTNKDANSSQSPDLAAFERCTEAKERWKKSTSKRINPLIEKNCNQSHPRYAKFFLERVLNYPLNSNFSENSILSEETFNMSKVDFNAKALKGSIYSRADCKRSYDKCALKHHPDKGGSKEKFVKGCHMVYEQCILLAERQNLYVIKIQNIFAQFWAICFPPRQQILLLPQN